MQATPDHKIPDDEIDLASTWKKIYSFFAYPVSLLFSNILTSLCFIIAAILLAVILKSVIPKTYRSSFIIRPNDKTERFHMKIFGDLQSLISNQEYGTLAQELKISEADAGSICGISVFNPSVGNTKDSTNYSIISLEVLDHHLFIPLQKSLLAYLENNPYFLKIKTIQAEQIARELEQVNKDLVQLDSLKKSQLESYEGQKLSVQNNILLKDLVNPTATYAMAIDRMNKKTNLMARQVFVDNFQVIKSCIEVKQAAWPPRILIMCAVLIPCSLLLCVIFLHAKRRALEKRKHI